MTIEFKYGLGNGALVCAWILLQYAFGLHTTNIELGLYAGYFSNLIPAVMLFLLLRRKQRAIWDGRLSFARGIWTGLQMAFVSALLVYTFLVIYHHFINPTWIDGMIEWNVAKLRAAGQEEAIIRERILAYREAYSPIGLALSRIVGMTLFGGLLALIITALLRILPTPRTD